MEPLVSASPTNIQADLSDVLEDYDTPLAKKFQILIGRIVTAVSNATAISYGVDVSEGTGVDVLSSLPEPVRNAVETQQRELTKRFVGHWNNPLCSELEFVLQKRVNKEECRHLAFFPSEEQIHYYVLLVQDPPDGAPDNHPQRKIRQMFLSLLYLVHIENWSLVRTFIASGGLMALVDHVASKNLGIRSQAIDIVHRITSTQYFDWFQQPKDHQGKVLHQRFLELSKSKFIQNLLLNAPTTDSAGGGGGGGAGADSADGEGFLPSSTFQGAKSGMVFRSGTKGQGYYQEKLGSSSTATMGSLFSLQILAFWLSWVRKLYSKDGELRLSREILGTLKRWSRVNRTQVTSQDEIDLATKVYEDFSRLPPADGVEGHHVNVSSSNGGDDGGGGNEEDDSSSASGGETKAGDKQQQQKEKKKKEKKEPTLTPKQRADRGKKDGNKAFQEGRHVDAIVHYTEAITADSSRSVLHANRAACHLALGKAAASQSASQSAASQSGSGDTEDVVPDVVNNARKVVSNCNEAIRLHPTYVKAFYRRAQGQLLLQQYDSALKDVEQGIVLARKELQGKPPKDMETELKKSLRKMKDWKLKTLNKKDAALRKSRGWSKQPGSTILSAVGGTLPGGGGGGGGGSGGSDSSSNSNSSSAVSVDGVIASSKLGSGIVDALMRREKFDNNMAGPKQNLTPETLQPSEEGGSGSKREGGSSDVASFVNAAAAVEEQGSVPRAPSSDFMQPLQKKEKKKKKKMSNTAAAAAAADVKKKKKKKKLKVEEGIVGVSCVIDGIGSVDPPRTAMSVEKVVQACLKRDSSGSLLIEYFTKTFVASKYRKVLKENINENILLGMIAVAVQLSKQPDHEPLAQHLKGLSRVRRLESAILFLDAGPREMLKLTIEDMVVEESESNLIRDAFGMLFK